MPIRRHPAAPAIAGTAVGAALLIWVGVASALTRRRLGLQAQATDAARRHDVPIPIFLATIEIESRWNPRAKNCRGTDGEAGCAWGLAQMTPGTIRAAGYAGHPSDLLEDSGLALDLAARYMADWQRRWGGTTDAMRYRVLWAWGPGRAAEWPPAPDGAVGQWSDSQGRYLSALRKHGWTGPVWTRRTA